MNEVNQKITTDYKFWWKFHIFDVFFLVAMYPIINMFGAYVHSIFKWWFVGVMVLLAIILILPSPFNRGKKNYQGLWIWLTMQFEKNEGSVLHVFDW